MAKCKLCGEEKILRNSHILPEFIFKPLYDSKHRFHVLSTIPDDKNRLYQKGAREELLCDDCEQIFSKYERYASIVFNQSNSIDVHQINNEYHFSGIKYDFFKLFQLSILWRIGISEHTGFEEIDIGPHEQKIRTMLINKESGRYFEYGTIMIALLGDKKLLNGLIITPEQFKYNGFTFIRVVFAGFIWLFIVSSHSSRFPFKDYFLSEDDKLIIQVRNAENMNFIKKFARNLHDLGKLEE